MLGSTFSDDYRQMFGLGDDASAEYEFLDCASGA